MDIEPAAGSFTESLFSRLHPGLQVTSGLFPVTCLILFIDGVSDYKLLKLRIVQALPASIDDRVLDSDASGPGSTPLRRRIFRCELFFF